MPFYRLYIILQLGSQIEIIDQIFHPDTLLPDDPCLLPDFSRQRNVLFQGAGMPQDHGQRSPDIVGYSGDPVGPGGLLFSQGIALSLQFFGHTVYGSRQLGHKSLFRNIYFFLIAQGFNSMDNRFHRADDPGSSHPIDNNDKDQIKDQKFQDQIKEIPDQIIVKSRPHQFKIPVLGEAQKQKILPLCRRCGRIVLDISPDSPGNFSQSIMPGDFLGQIPAGPDHIPCIILYQDSPGSGLFQRFLSFF